MPSPQQREIQKEKKTTTWDEIEKSKSKNDSNKERNPLVLYSNISPGNIVKSNLANYID